MQEVAQETYHRHHDCAPLQKLAGLPGDLVVLQKDVLWRRPVGFAPPAPDQHPQLVVPEHADNIP